MTRAEYLEWCKKRAREYLDAGALGDAVASILSDLGKNPETEKSVQPELSMIGIVAAANGDSEFVRRFIEGFR
jgi:hypothetical protein